MDDKRFITIPTFKPTLDDFDSEYQYYIYKIINLQPIVSQKQFDKFMIILGDLFSLITEEFNNKYRNRNANKELVAIIKNDLPFLKFDIKQNALCITGFEKWFLQEKNLYIDRFGELRYHGWYKEEEWEC